MFYMFLITKKEWKVFLQHKKKMNDILFLISKRKQGDNFFLSFLPLSLYRYIDIYMALSLYSLVSSLKKKIDEKKKGQ